MLPKFQLQKFILKSKDVKNANSFRLFDKILSEQCWDHLPCGDVIFF